MVGMECFTIEVCPAGIGVLANTWLITVSTLHVLSLSNEKDQSHQGQLV